MTSTQQPLRREGVHLWLWTITSATYPFKRRKTTWRMIEDDARARHGDDAVKVEGTLWIPEVGTSSYKPPGPTREREPGEDDE
jgi:hypothetical protein